MSVPKTTPYCDQLLEIVKQALDECPHKLDNTQLKESALAAIKAMRKRKCIKACAYLMKYSLESPSYHGFVCRDFAIQIHNEAKKCVEG